MREEGSFASLPLLVRALGALLIKICDDTGIIHTGGRAPAEAIAFQLGADRNDRHTLPRLLDALLADQYLVMESNGDIRVRNFRTAQLRWDRVRGEHELTDERPANHQRTISEPSTDKVTTTHCESNIGISSNQAAPLETIRNDTKRRDISSRAGARALAAGAVEKLNRLAETKHSPVAKGTLLDFETIARDGFTLEQVLAVVDAKVAEWRGDEKMAKYLRPSALFRPSNFRRYAADAEGGLPRLNGKPRDPSIAGLDAARIARERLELP